MKRRGFVAGSIGGGLAGLTGARAEETAATEKQVDRRPFGKTGAEVSIYGLGLGSAFSKPFASDPEGRERTRSFLASRL